MHKAYHPDHRPEFFDYDETCPNCEREIPIVVDDEEFRNYEVICPVCGKPLLLCGQCNWDLCGEGRNSAIECDWCESTGCFRQRTKK